MSDGDDHNHVDGDRLWDAEGARVGSAASLD